MDFPSRKEIAEKVNFYSNSNREDDTDYQSDLLSQLEEIVNNIDPTKISNKDVPIKKEQILEQKEYFWIRIYLKDEDSILKKGDEMKMLYLPTNEEIEMIFGAYEKEGLVRDHDDEVINYISDNNTKILCCMIDLQRVNKRSEDIPTIRTFFRNSRHYQETLLRKDDLKIVRDKDEFEFTSISF